MTGLRDTGKSALPTLPVRLSDAPAPLSRERMVDLIRLAQTPLAKALVALAYYSSTDDHDVADAVWARHAP